MQSTDVQHSQANKVELRCDSIRQNHSVMLGMGKLHAATVCLLSTLLLTQFRAH